jgi:hypothetical protein
MATIRLSIFGAATLPDTSGNVWPEPAAVTQTNDHYAQTVWRFKDTATKDSLGFRFSVPSNFVSSPVFEVIWTSTATSGNVVWNADYNSGSKTATLDPSTDEENLTVTTGAPGTSQTGVASQMSATAGNFAANDVCQGKISRNGASGSDTMAADAVVYDVIFQYADA